jgi:hypothetical protein
VISGTWPEQTGSPVFIRGYGGRKYEELIEAYHRDAVLLLAQGYEPAGQHYVEGQWGITWGLVALLLTPFLIGLIIWVPILTTRPNGTLTVSYVHRATTHEAPSTIS